MTSAVPNLVLEKVKNAFDEKLSVLKSLLFLEMKHPSRGLNRENLLLCCKKSIQNVNFHPFPYLQSVHPGL